MKTTLSILFLCVSGLACAQPRISRELRNEFIRNDFLDFLLWLDSNQYDHGKLRMEEGRFGKKTLRYVQSSDSTIAFKIGRQKGVLNPNTGKAFDLKGEQVYANQAIRFRNWKANLVHLEDELGAFETDTSWSYETVKRYRPQPVDVDKTVEYIIRTSRVTYDDGRMEDRQDTITTWKTYDQANRLVEYERKASGNEATKFRIDYVEDTIIETLIYGKPKIATDGKIYTFSSPTDLIKRHVSKMTDGTTEVTQTYEYTVRDGQISESTVSVRICKGKRSLAYAYEKRHISSNLSMGIKPVSNCWKVRYRLKY